MIQYSTAVSEQNRELSAHLDTSFLGYDAKQQCPEASITGPECEHDGFCFNAPSSRELVSTSLENNVGEFRPHLAQTT
jgi:hypothetical protein